MKLWFRKRGHPRNIVNQELEEAGRTNKRSRGVCLVVTYYPLFQNIGRIFHRHLDLLYTDQEVERVSTSGPTASFRSATKVSSYLVRALERRIGSFKCRVRCSQVCLNVTETEMFISLSNN